MPSGLPIAGGCDGVNEGEQVGRVANLVLPGPYVAREGPQRRNLVRGIVQDGAVVAADLLAQGSHERRVWARSLLRAEKLACMLQAAIGMHHVVRKLEGHEVHRPAAAVERDRRPTRLEVDEVQRKPPGRHFGAKVVLVEVRRAVFVHALRHLQPLPLRQGKPWLTVVARVDVGLLHRSHVQPALREERLLSGSGESADIEREWFLEIIRRPAEQIRPAFPLARFLPHGQRKGRGIELAREAGGRQRSLKLAVVAIMLGERGDEVFERERAVAERVAVAEHTIAHAIHAYRPHHRCGYVFLTEGHVGIVHGRCCFRRKAVRRRPPILVRQKQKRLHHRAGKSLGYDVLLEGDVADVRQPGGGDARRSREVAIVRF